MYTLIVNMYYYNHHFVIIKNNAIYLPLQTRQHIPGFLIGFEQVTEQTSFVHAISPGDTHMHVVHSSTLQSSPTVYVRLA